MPTASRLESLDDSLSLPVAITIASASPHETQLVEQTLNASFLPDNPKRLIGDAAYDSDGLDQIRQIPDEVLDALKRQPCPGNVRELQNVIERAVIATQGTTLVLAPAAEEQPNAGVASSRTLADVERDHILEATNGWSAAGMALPPAWVRRERR